MKQETIKKDIEVTPPGWEDVVKKLKTIPQIENPFALVNWMSGQGFNPKGSKGKGKEIDPLIIEPKQWLEYYKQYKNAVSNNEVGSASSLGQLQRNSTRYGYKASTIPPLQAGYNKNIKENKKVKESRKIKFLAKFIETEINEDNREVGVVLLLEGLGNKRDKHFYTKDAIENSAHLFEGAQCYADHPSAMEETQRPERSIRDLIGWFREVKAMKLDSGRYAIKGIWKCVEGSAYDWAWQLAKESINYQNRYEALNYVGFSINANGVTHPGEDENKDIIHFVDKITDVFSCDMVTKPGAGGKFLTELKENFKENCKSSIKEVKNEMEKFKEKIDGIVKGIEAIKAKVGEYKGAEGEDGDMMPKALDEIISQLQKLGDYEKPVEDEAIVPPVKDGKPAEPAEDESEDEDEGEDEKGMKESNKKLKEDLKISNQKLALMESAKLVEKKLIESHLPAGTYDDLKEVLIGKDEKYMNKMIEARKTFIATLAGKVDGVEGNREKVAEQKLTESKEKLKGIIPLK